MNIPAILFGSVLALVFGAAFHFYKRGSWKKLVLYLVLALAGFWIGHIIGDLAGWHFVPIGPLNAGPGILVCIVFLFGGEWLGRVEVSSKK
jgi:hypothetical protein